MARTLLIVAILLTSTGCPERHQPDNTTAQQLAQRTIELERARESESFWQSTATILGSLIVLALIVGMVLGSKAKDDSDER
jgi:hypothetical protein